VTVDARQSATVPSWSNAVTFTPNLVVGAGIMLLGVVLILGRAGVVDARALLQLWPVLLIVFGASVVLQALRRPDAPPARAEDPNCQTSSVPLVALLVILFLLVSHLEARREVRAAPPGMHAASVFTLTGRHEHVVPPQPFHGAEVTTIMGRSELDVSQALPGPGGEAVVDVLGVMGRVVVTVPKDWRVDVQTTTLLAGVRTRRAAPEADVRQVPALPPDILERPDSPPDALEPPRLVLRGVVLMGTLVVQ
jgi:hypothetical protein